MNVAQQSISSLPDQNRRVEYSAIRLDFVQRLDHVHARWLRGAILQVVNRVEFHNHRPDGRLVYQHPQVRYDTSQGDASVIGLSDGALLVRGLPKIGSLRLGSQEMPVARQSLIVDRLQIGPSGEMIAYDFQSPYLALNQENSEAWKRSSLRDRTRLLERVVVGNLLSFSKAIGLNVASRLEAEVELCEAGHEEFKPGLRLQGFRGSFRANFVLPQLWGIGKSSSRGFGTVLRRES